MAPGNRFTSAASFAEALALAHGAIIRDMRGAWLDRIVPISTSDLDEDPPHDFMQQTAQTFCEFPYPESVVIWKGDGPSSQTYVFNRSDRRRHGMIRTVRTIPSPL
jgi:hypothetical protein